MRAFIGVLVLVAGGAILYLGFFRQGIKQGIEKLLKGGWEAMFGFMEDKSRGWVFALGMTLVIIGILIIVSEAGC
jgi:hypothetical protein